MRLYLARLLLPVIARAMMKDIPEVERLFGENELLARMLDPEMVGAVSIPMPIARLDIPRQGEWPVTEPSRASRHRSEAAPESPSGAEHASLID